MHENGSCSIGVLPFHQPNGSKAMQVDQPDPGAASKVAYYLTSAQTGLSMYIDLPSGQQVLRQIEVFNPKKKVTVPSRK